MYSNAHPRIKLLLICMHIHSATQLMRAVGWDGEVDADITEAEHEKAEPQVVLHEETANKLQKRDSTY